MPFFIILLTAISNVPRPRETGFVFPPLLFLPSTPGCYLVVFAFLSLFHFFVSYTFRVSSTRFLGTRVRGKKAKPSGRKRGGWWLARI